MAFSSEPATGSREENASKQKAGAPVPIESEAPAGKRLDRPRNPAVADGEAIG
jgi:hypothetical protein